MKVITDHWFNIAHKDPPYSGNAARAGEHRYGVRRLFEKYRLCGIDNAVVFYFNCAVAYGSVV